jgi:hypothetical protein
MKSVNCSITGLTKSAETFKTMLEKAGLNVEIDVFQTGRGGNAHYGPSFVELTISDEDGTHLTDAKVYAGGFGDIVTWTSVKKDILNKLMQAAA